jgi:polysaccharide biosynthesis/export protein
VKTELGKCLAFCGAIVALLVLCEGCRSFSEPAARTTPVDGNVGNGLPRELRKTVLPAYVIEPPDILSIDAIHAVPKQPYKLQPFDTVSIMVEGTPPDAPIAGIYPVGADGNIVIPRYGPEGTIHVAGMTIEGDKEKQVKGAKELLADRLRTRLNIKESDISMTLADSAARQRISGPHLVGMDGTVTLGTYGNVSVVGLTLSQAKAAIEQHLLQMFDSLEVSVEVSGFNSKVYYIVTQGAGFGDGVYRFPMTGNETVLDALSQINGLRPVSSKKVWIARPTDDPNCTMRLEVCWEDVTANAYARTNYQILPGDRIFVAEDHLIAINTALDKMLNPIERVMGFSIFGAGTITRFSGHVLEGGGNGNAAF